MTMDYEHGVILAVDDTPENLGLLFEYLDQAGFTVLLVQNGENALKQAEQNLPDLILLDIMMPGLNGFEVCQLLKKNAKTRGIPVIFMTALNDPEDKIKGFELGGVDYITKPIQYREVLARVKTHLTLRRLQQELEEKNRHLERQGEQLQELNASKDRFFSILSHDLRSPFNGLCGITEILLDHFDDFPPEKIKDFLGRLKESTDMLYALLENLLTWSRVQAGRLDYFPQQLEIHELIRNTVQLFSPNAEQKQISLVNTVKEPVYAVGDGKMIDTVIRNLLSNAIKFTHPGGKVHISAQQDETQLTVSVSDSGIGIDKDHQPRLFRIDESFKRLGTAEERGTGLGLILCKEFIEQHHGTIWVESESGKGSTFRFTLPLHRDEKKDRSQTQTSHLSL